MNTPQTKATAAVFLKTRKSGVLSTLSPEQTPRARIVYYAADSSFVLYFLTLKNTRKVEDMTAFPQVAFTVFDEQSLQTLQLEGYATDITNAPVPDAILEKLFDNLEMHSSHYGPLARLDRSDVVVYKITPTWIRYGDFTQGEHSDDVYAQLKGE